MITLEQIELRHLKVPLKAPFETSFGQLTEKDCVLVIVHGDGVTGYGESVAMPLPFYNEETTGTVWSTLESFVIPQLLGKSLEHPREVTTRLAWIRGHRMAISALEGAVWDLYARQQKCSLSSLLGGTRSEIEVGVSIGIEPSVDTVVANVERFLAEGYKKIKIKIKPGFDVAPVRAIRERFGNNFPLMVDANSAYTLADIPLFKELDQYNLLMIEQPLAHDDIIDHAKLQSALTTPICLDESIHSTEDARKAIELGSTRTINIKIGRVGGLTNAKAIHDYCAQKGVPVWCGGMLELGVGRAHNIAIASLPNFSIAGDTSASSRSFAVDIVQPAVAFSRPGVLAVPTGPGIGYEIDQEALERFTVRKESFSAF